MLGEIETSLEAESVGRPSRVTRVGAMLRLWATATLITVLPVTIAGILGRTLDPRSLAGFALLFGVALALPLRRVVAAGDARPLWWVGIGVLSLACFQVADVLAVWWRSSQGEGAYAAASSLARAVFLLQLFAVAGSGFSRARPGRGIGGLILRSAPALLVATSMEIAPAGWLSVLYGARYGRAVPELRVLAGAMLLSGVALVLVQLLLHADRISWVSWTAAAAAILVPVALVVNFSHLGLAWWMLAMNALVVGALAVHARRLLFPKEDTGRILFLAWRDRRHPEGGGSEVYVEEIARRLAASGREVTIFCASHRDAPRSEVVDGVRFVRRGGRVTVYLWAALLHLIGRVHNHDLVVDVQNGVPFFSPLYCSRRVVVLVHHVHREQWPVVFKAGMARFGWWIESKLAPSLYSRASYVAVSEATRSELASLGIEPSRIRVVHNGVGSRISRALPVKTAAPSIVYLGRLVPHKRLELLLEAAGRLRTKFPSLTVTIAGRGWWEGRLRTRTEQLGVGDVVRFVGWVDERTKASLLAESWVLAMPSIKEGWGIAVLEAAAAGTPSVGFRVGGLSESILDGETGLVVDDQDGFVRALESVLADPSLRERLGRQAAVRAAQFDWGKSASRFEEVLCAQRVGATVPAIDEPVRVSL